VVMITGDNARSAATVAGVLGIKKVLSEVLPEDKSREIKRLQQSGSTVAFVGDGINDAPALAQADVGFAMGTGINMIREASDLTLMSSNPNRILHALELSALTSRAIRQNLFFAFFYNSFAIPLALAGLLNPLVAVLAMFLSSLTVIANTLRFSKRGRISLSNLPYSP